MECKGEQGGVLWVLSGRMFLATDGEELTGVWFVGLMPGIFVFLDMNLWVGGWEKLQGGWVGVCPWVALCQDKQEDFQETPTSSLLLADW